MEHLEAWWLNLESNLLGQWYMFAIIAVVGYGLYQYLLDASIEARCKSHGRGARSMFSGLMLCGGALTITLLSGAYLLLLADKERLAEYLTVAVILGFLQGVLFLYSNLFRFEARKVYPNSVVLPVTRSSVLIVILASWFLFDESAILSSNRLVGFVLIGLAIYLFRDYETRNDSEEPSGQQRPIKSGLQKAGLCLLMATVVSASMSLLSKYAVGPTGIDIFMFIFVSNLAVLMATLYMLQKHVTKVRKSEPRLIEEDQLGELARSTFLRGMVLGIINFLAFASFLNALSLNDASVVVPIFSLHIVVPVVMTAIIQGDVLTPKTTVGVVLSIAAVIILQ